MKRFIGGVIITVLLSNPLALESNMITYNYYYSPEKILNIIKRKDEEVITTQSLENAFDDSYKNKMMMYKLIKIKNNLYNKIMSVLNIRSNQKSKNFRMNEEQINIFQKFMAYYHNISDTINKNIDLIHIENIQKLKDEVLSGNTHYAHNNILVKDCSTEKNKKIFIVLKKILNLQKETIKILNELIFRCNNTYNVIRKC